MIFIIEDDLTMAECIKKACSPHPAQIFSNCYDAIAAIDRHLPQLIFLDILLPGPNGFTLLHELASYIDTAKIPIIILSSIDFTHQDLSTYGVVACLHKDSFTPKDIRTHVSAYIQ